MVIGVDLLARVRRRARCASVEVSPAALLPLSNLARRLLDSGRCGSCLRHGDCQQRCRRRGSTAVAVACGDGALSGTGEYGGAGDGVLAGGRHGVNVDEDAGVVGFVDARDAVCLGRHRGPRTADNVDLGAFHLQLRVRRCECVSVCELKGGWTPLRSQGPGARMKTYIKLSTPGRASPVQCDHLGTKEVMAIGNAGGDITK